MSALAAAHGAPVLSGRLRSSPEDFRVDEIAGFEPSGAGEHLLLTVRKRGMTTPQAARRIAAWAGVAEMGVGYAGLKDRHAVTTQRFSVHLPKRVAPDLAALQDDDLQVLDSAWHARKLPRGALAGNRFTLVLREVAGDAAAAEARLQAIRERGLPNYFGVQRFGRGGDNVESARRMFAGQRVRREQRSLLLSAARSELFNRVLSARVEAGNWDTGLPGEVWMLDGSASVFGPQAMDEALQARLAAFDIHPTGPMWGRGGLRSQDEVAALEAAIAGAEPELCAGLEAAGLRQERRALRIRASDLAWRWLAPDALELGFVLPPGSYATVLVAQLATLDLPADAGAQEAE